MPITYNVLIAIEALYCMNYKYRGWEGNFVLKLNMSQAYGRIEWDFVEKKNVDFRLSRRMDSSD